MVGSRFFEDMTLQPGVSRLLMQEISGGTASHAYLFVGPSGSGKKSLALRFAFGLFAESDSAAELFFKEQRHPDLLVLSRPEKKTVLTKNQITEELIPWLGYKPYQAQKKIAILQDAHTLSMEGANALLKTLEEPPAYAVLILVSDQENLLETIRSRCRMVSFPAVQTDALQQFLAEHGAPCEKAREIALISRGDVTLALSFLESDLTALKRRAMGFLEDLGSGNYSAVFSLAQALEKEGKPLFQFLWMLLRDQLVLQETGRPELLFLADAAKEQEGGRELRLSSRQEMIENWTRIQKLWGYYQRNVNTSAISVNIALALRRCLLF